jgi:hypothetical protein
MVGGEIGAIDGVTIGQIAGGQIGGRSIELSQSGRMFPLTHWQMHSALAVTGSSNNDARIISRIICPLLHG